MRIVLDARKYFDFGIGTYIQNLVAQIVNYGEIIILVNSIDENKILNNPTVKKKTNSSAKYSFGELFSIASDANKLGADVFHSPHYTVPFGLKMPCVTTIHDVLHIKGRKYFPLHKRLYAKTIISHACNVSDAIIVDSDFTKNELLSIFPKVEEKMYVVHLGISNLYSQESSQEEIQNFRRAHRILGQSILYTGNIKPHKNLKTLISAFAELKDLRNIQLVFSGTSVLKNPSLCELIKQNGIEDRIVELGQLSEYQLMLAYKAASVVVLPSFYEGFGFSVLEAMASGTPAIGARAASIPEIMGDGGILFDPYSSEELTTLLEKVLSDTEMRSILIRKGYQNIKRFSWEQCAKRTFNIYESVI